MKHFYALLITLACSIICSAQVKIGNINYLTLNDAFFAINGGAHTGAISVLITGNVTDTQEVILKKSGVGQANYTSINISPSGGAHRTILLQGLTSSFALDGANNVTIDGLNSQGNSLTIARSHLGSSTIWLGNGASNNTVRRCTVLGSGSTGVIRIQSASNVGNTNNNEVSDCNIGPYDSNLPAIGISIDTDYGWIYGTIIRSNSIHDFGSATYPSSGINVGKNVQSFNIENNRIYQTAARAYAANYGIHVSSDDALVAPERFITGNIIGGANNQGTGYYTLTSGNFTGIRFRMRAIEGTCHISNNTVANIAMTGESNGVDQNSPFKGILLENGLVEVTANTIGSMSAQNSITFSTTANADAEVMGICNMSIANAVISNNFMGGITATSIANAKMNFTGIYTQDNDVNNSPITLCTGNVIGGNVANSIQCNSTAVESTVSGIVHNYSYGYVRNNTVRNLTGSGTGFNEQVPFGVVGIRYEKVLNPTQDDGLSGNVVYNLTNNNPNQVSSVCGIFINSTGILVARNFVHSLLATSTHPDSMTEGLALKGNTCELVNNMVVLGNNAIRGSRINGIRTLYFGFSGGFNRIHNNSVYIGGSPVSGNGATAALSMNQNNFDFPIYNNILVNNRSNNGSEGAHYSIAVGSGPGKPSFRANVFHGSGNGYVLGIRSGLQQATLGQWHSWSQPGSDFGYFDVPHFANPTAAIPDLHINPNIATVVESNAYQPPSEDFDQQPRQQGWGDIGADEGNFMPLTAPVIQSVYVPQPACAATGLYITITGTSMTGITQFKIGDVVYPISNNYDAGNGIGVLSASMSLAASGPITLTNSEGSTVGQVVTISSTPTISAHPQNVTVCPSQVATFTVTATGAQSYQWRRNGIPISNGGAFSNVTTSTLTVSNPTEAATGTYDVVVTGGASVCTVTSNPATLTIGSQSLLVAASGPTDLCQGQSVTLSPTMQTSALQFDGVNDSFIFPNYNYFENFTISFWIRTNQIAPSGPNWYDGNGIIDGTYFGISQVGNKLAFGVDGVSYTLLSNGNINTGEWIHVAVTRRPDTGIVQIYLNGQLNATGVVNPGTSLSPSDIRVGAHLNGNKFFNGALDDIRIWHRQLTNSELQSIQIGGNISNANLTHHYAFNEGSGSSVLNAVTGTNTPLSGAPQWTSRIGEASFDNYFWSNGQNTRTITVTQSGDYSVYGYNDNCPNISNTVWVSVSNPVVQIQGTGNIYCGGEPVVMEASGAQTYSWSSSDGLTQAVGPVLSVTPLSSTFYTVTGTTANGCSSTKQYMVMVEPPVQLDISASSTYILAGQSVNLTASMGSGVYTWSPSTGLDSGSGQHVIASPAQTTTYTVSGVGCQIPQSITIYVLPEPSATDNALDFDGINDFVSFPIHANFVSGTFAVSMWVKPLHPTKTMHLFSTRNGAQPNTFDIQIRDGNKIQGDIGNGISWLTTSADATFAYQPNVWMHIAYVIKPGTYKIYVNGQMIQSGYFPGEAVLFNSTNQLTLGASAGEDTYLRGVIDDLNISTFDFPEGIMANAPIGGIPALYRYPFDHGIAGGLNPSVTMLANMAPENYHGTLHNFALADNFSNWVQGQERAPQAITFGSVSSVPYGSANFTLGATASSGLPVTYFSANPSVATVSGNTVTVVGVGETTIFAEQNGDGFYTPAQPQFQQLIVTPKPLTLANAAAANKPYDRTTAATITGTLSGVLPSESVTFTGGGNFATYNVGNGIAVTANLSLQGPHAGNYMLSQPAVLSANITKKPLTTSGAYANDKVFNGLASATISGTALIGVIAPDQVQIGSTSGTFATHLPGNNIPVTASLSIVGANSGNYQLIQPTGLSANITSIEASAVLTGGGTTCNSSAVFVYVHVAGVSGTTTVKISDGTTVFTISDYPSGHGIGLQPTAATYTLISVTRPGYVIAASGSATVMVQEQHLFYVDADGDGYTNGSQLFCLSAPPPGYSATSLGEDCNDQSADINPGQTEILGNNIDENCDGSLDMYCYTVATWIFGIINYFQFNTIGHNSVGSLYSDFSSISTEVVAGGTYPLQIGTYNPWFWMGTSYVWIDLNNDYDFDDPGELVYSTPYEDGGLHLGAITIPAGTEPGAKRMRVKFDILSGDNPCGQYYYGEAEDYTVVVTPCVPKIWYADADGDGFGNPATGIEACAAPQNYVANSGDCDDGDNQVWQTGAFFIDADGDGYDAGTAVLCFGAEVPPGYAPVSSGADCNDGIASIHPGAVEIFGNGIDDNCTGTIDEGAQVTTQIAPSQCGTTLTVIGSLISAVNVQNSTGYRFEVTNTATGAVQVIDRPMQWFSLTMLSQYDYATTYSIRVMLQRNNVWVGYYGPSCQVSSPAILSQNGAAQVSASQCGMTLPTINTLIATNSIPNTTGYRFRITNLTDPSAPNQVQVIDRGLHWFSLTMLTTYTYGTTYLVEVAVKTNGAYSGFGSPCMISTPAVPTLTNCGAAIATSGTLISTVSRNNTASYRFEFTNMSTNIVTTIDRPVQWLSFKMVVGYSPNTQYSVRVALMTSGVYSLFGDACVITSPGAAREVDVKPVVGPFNAVAHPNPFVENFGIHMTNPAETPISVKIYDMTGRLLQAQTFEASEIEDNELGASYPAGVYNVVVAQGENVSTLRVVKR